MEVSSFKIKALAFFTWWGTELKGLLPPKAVAFLWDENEAIGVIASNASLLVDGEAQDISDDAIKGQPIDLVLEEGWVMSRHVSMPQMSGGNSAQAIDHKIARLFPLQKSQMYVGYRKVGESDEVEILAANKEKLSDVFNPLSEAQCQLRSLRLQTHGASEAPVDIPIGQVEGVYSKGTSDRLSLYLMASVAAVMALGFWMTLSSLARYEAGLLSDLASKSRDAQQSTQLVNTWDAYAKRKEFISGRLSALDLQAILEEISHVVPQHSWVSDFQMSQAVINIHGQTESPSELVRALENSNMFGAAELISSTEGAGSGTALRYHIRLRLEGERE